jgi:hypothetical protein
MKLRSLFTLPYGYVVKTMILPKARFVKHGGGESDMAFWRSDTQTIYLRKDRQPTEQWMDYLHELDHMWVDYREWLQQQASIMP